MAAMLSILDYAAFEPTIGEYLPPYKGRLFREACNSNLVMERDSPCDGCTLSPVFQILDKRYVSRQEEYLIHLGTMGQVLSGADMRLIGDRPCAHEGERTYDVIPPQNHMRVP